MNRAQLLRRLQQAAAGRDERGVRETLDALGQNGGWSRDVADFIDRLPRPESDVIEDVMGPTPGDEDGTFVAAGPTGQPTGIRTATSSMAGVSQDAASAKYVPASASEWTTTLAVAGIGSGGPSALLPLQEASGNPVDVIGALPFTASGTLAYQQAIAGWTRLGIKTTAGSAGKVQSTSASLPDLTAASCLMLGYVLMPSGAAVLRSVLSMGGTFGNRVAADFDATPRIIGVSGANTANGTANPTSAVRAIVVKRDFTGNITTIYTDQEKLSPAQGAMTAIKEMTIGGDNVHTSFPDNTTYAYFASFFGSAAEISDASVRTLLQTLGWTVGW